MNKFPLPQYLGNKYKHLDWIGKHLHIDNSSVILDVFAGSHSVSYYFKSLGYTVIANDFMEYSNQIGKALVENSHDTLNKQDIGLLLRPNRDNSKYNLIRELYTGLFFIEKDAEFLDSFRSNVPLLSTKYKQSLALTIINRAMTRKVTMGHFAHTKALEYAVDANRIKRNKSLVVCIKDIFLSLVEDYNKAVFHNNKNNKSACNNALDFVANYSDRAQIAYFDPPYAGSHSDYQSFYHVLETYTRYWRNKKFINSVKCYYPKLESGFVKKCEILASFTYLFEKAADIKYWLISYNNKSYPDITQMFSLLRQFKKNVEINYKIYTNNKGGKGSTKGSSEILFICY